MALSDYKLKKFKRVILCSDKIDASFAVKSTVPLLRSACNDVEQNLKFF